MIRDSALDCAYFLDLIEVNMNNEKLDDAAFRQVIRNSLPDLHMRIAKRSDGKMTGSFSRTYLRSQLASTRNLRISELLRSDE